MRQYCSIIPLLGKVMLFCIATAFVHAQVVTSSPENPNAHFDVTQIVEQVSHNPTMPHSHDANRFENAKVTEWSREGEFLIDTNIIHAPSISKQCSVSVAFDGTNYFVVWTDCRNDSFYDIYGTRVDQHGVVLDPIGIAISTAANEQSTPSVAFDGTNFLVVWTDWRAYSSSDIYGARVDQSGNVLDTAGIIISTGADNQYAPALAFDSTNYLVVWQDGNNQYSDLYGARVDTSGNVLDSTAIAISTDVYPDAGPSVAFDGTNYLVVWSNSYYDSYICGARVDQSGNVLNPTGIIISPGIMPEMAPSVAFDGTNYLVVWHQGTYHWTVDIYGARVDTAGNVLDPYGIGICTIAELQCVPAVAFDGTNYLVVWQDCGGYFPASVCGARVDTCGTVLDPTGIVIATGGLFGYETWYPSIAFGATTYLVVWEDSRNDYNKDIYGTRVGPSGAILDSLNICMSTDINEQRNPAVSSDNINYLVVWEDTRIDHSDIYGTRVGQSGNILDPTGIPISIDCPQQQCSPALAFNTNHNRYLVAWNGASSGYVGIYGTRMGQSGNVLDTAEIEIYPWGGPNYCPSVASSGLHYLVAWNGHPVGGGIKGARVHQGGWVMDPWGFEITDTGKDASVAFDGINYLVVWRVGFPSNIYGARVTQFGNVLDPPPGRPISTAAGEQSCPSVAFDGTNYLVVWQDRRDRSDADIYCTRVAPSGIALDPEGIPISIAVGEQWYPSVAFNGTDYVVAWQDNRNSSWDIYGAKLNTSGIVIDTFSVSLQPGDQISPALAHSAGEQFLITYSGWTGEYGGKTYNKMRIWGKFYPFVGVEEHAQRLTPCAQRILQISPNPFRHSTDIRYQITDDCNDIVLEVYDITGRKVREVTKQSSVIGHQSSVKWDGTDDANRPLSSGVYFIQLQANDYRATEKILLVR